MKMLAKVGGALQRLLGSLAEIAAQETAVIQRRREFTPISLAKTFVLGYLWKPQATMDELAMMAVQCGANVSPQAVDQRRTEKLANFLKRLFLDSLKIVIASHRPLAPLLSRFPSVTIMDSSTISLPDSLKKEFPGCGGGYGQGQAAMKLQTELDLCHGTLSHVEVEVGKVPDAATCRQNANRGSGSLKITDLGYFNIPVFAAMVAAGEYFLSRLQFGTGVLLPHHGPLRLLEWLATQTEYVIDCSIQLGLKDRLPCRLIAWRVPPEVANRRRQKLRADMNSRKGKAPSAERLAWCDWSILVTNVPLDLLSPIEAIVLYRSRWQIELLFKRWKSQGLVDELIGSNDVRKMVGVWSRLLACVVQHWLLVGLVWGDARISLTKAGKLIRDSAAQIAASLDKRSDLVRVMEDMIKCIIKTCRRNKRLKPGTFELLNNPRLLDFRLS
jgi:hypothetical protein